MQMFYFKKFAVNQSKTAMKIGTDAVLLGAWSSLDNNPNSILDIGSGTGVVALMLAQRSYAQTIDAVEIEENAYEQTVENFEQSNWSDRLFCYHASFQNFYKEMKNEKYDLIVSNPPFYTSSFKSKNQARHTARSTALLPFKELAKGVSKLLSETGVFSVIIPKKEVKGIIDITEKEQLFLNRICYVKGNPNSETKRCLLEFSKNKKEIKKEKLIIETGRHRYTKEYVNLTKKFYLKM